MKLDKITSVPTNIITGFLGVGKTSTIIQLFKHKPGNERWAVLVNEFGEIGVDGALLEGQFSQQQGVYIKEVPGGCMCCAAGVPMQIALNKLLATAKPDRLLIEPTGLGHPKEVLKVLSSQYYREALALQKTITLVDARKLSDPRYTEHETFNQQIAIADTIVGNKADLYQDEDKARLIDYVKVKGQANAKVIFAQQGNITLAELAGLNALNSSVTSKYQDNHKHNQTKKTLVSDMPIPESGFIKAVNSGEGFTSVGWRFSDQKIFDHTKLQTLLLTINAERIKASLITDKGRFGYNITSDGLTEIKLKPSGDKSKESYIEIITADKDDKLETKLLACLNPMETD